MVSPKLHQGRIVCSCGALIAQCRCIGPHEPDEVIASACPTCRGRPVASTLTVVDPPREPTASINPVAHGVLR